MVLCHTHKDFLVETFYFYECTHVLFSVCYKIIAHQIQMGTINGAKILHAI